MKKITFLTIMLFVISYVYSQSNVKLIAESTQAVLTESTQTNLSFTNSIESINLSNLQTKEGEFTKISIPGYFPNKHIGFPELPVMTKLIEIPYYAKPVVNIISYQTEIIQLDDYGFDQKIIPNQKSLFKNQDPAIVPFEMAAEVYEDYEFYQPEMIEVIYKSRMRGVNIAQIIVNPFQYDIETNTLTIIQNIEAEIIFENGDISKSIQYKEEKYSPAFESAYKSLWNYKSPQNKDELSKYPIKYVIVADRMFEDALGYFIEWKTKKGFCVITGYTDEIGSSNAEIKTFVQDLYEAGTPEDPAPTYLLIVGDVAQVPSFQMSGHVSDMYYCEFDGEGDYVPEMYFGRFSANNVEQLLPQIEKTLMFEQFTFPDSDFMHEAVLVAGHDNNWAPTHGNGQINYATTYYFNADRGVVDHLYLHPESNNLATEIIADISNGVGFVNFTAHCGSTGWAGPDFTTSDIPGLQNEDKYFFSVGNCCQSNKFEEAECFGEALLRADKKGAVIHIGGSNNTMWDEDYYWSVGIAANITAETTYDETSTAAYDHLFHDNEEDPYVTAYQMAFIGNMSVMASTSSQKKYYWEIYHVMGDPSLMPYVGTTPQLEADYLPVLSIGFTELLITTEPNAYAAISVDGELLDAKIADESGEALLQFEALMIFGEADIVVTKQFRKPHINTIPVIPTENDYDAMLQTINIPTANMHISQASFNPTVTILNLGEISLTSLNVGYYIDGGEPIEIEWTGNLETFETQEVQFPEIELQDGVYNFTAYVDSPNGQTDEFPENDQRDKVVTVYSGKVMITDILTPETINCNISSFEPSFVIRNTDDYPLTNLTCEYECGEIYEQFVWEGNLPAGETEVIAFPENTFPDGMNTITYYVSEPNGGTNLLTNNTDKSTSFMIISAGAIIEYVLNTDLSGNETTWELVDDDTQTVLYEGGPYASWSNEEHIYEWCLGEGCYTFTIFDDGGNGMSGFMGWGAGNALITNTESEEIILELPGADFTDSHSVNFCIEVSVLAEEYEPSIEFAIFPNPANDIVNVVSGINSEICIYNIMGQKIENRLNLNGIEQFDISDYPDGTFLIRITNGNKVSCEKFIKK
jgi:hypothetical protein